MLMLWQGGGPSHVDLFDPKDTLFKRSGENVPDSVRAARLSTMSVGTQCVVAPIKQFRRYGQCGMELSEMLPAIGELLIYVLFEAFMLGCQSCTWCTFFSGSGFWTLIGMGILWPRMRN